MALPGTKSPPCYSPKDSQGQTRLPEPNSKTLKEDILQFNGGKADIGTAPTNRMYTRDYTKIGRDKDDVDLITPALGNPSGI